MHKNNPDWVNIGSKRPIFPGMLRSMHFDITENGKTDEK
jgi:hypothetical protein